MKFITAKNTKEDLLQLQIVFEEEEVGPTNQNTIETELHHASSFGNLDQVKILLEQYGGLKSADQNGWTPLHFAAKQGHVDVLEYLINQGADVNDITNDGETAVVLATSSGKMAAVKNLIEEHGATLQDSLELNLINIAAKEGQVDIVKYLISRDDDVVIEFNSNETAIQLETRYKIQVIRDMIEDMVSRYVTQLYGFRPRSISQGDDIGIVTFIILRQTNVQDLADMCKTALLLAALVGELAAVKILIEKFNAEMVRNDEGWMPLHFAARGGYVDVVEYLINNGADANADNIDGKNAIQIAGVHEREEVVRLLRQHTARRSSPWIVLGIVSLFYGLLYLVYHFILFRGI